MNSILFDRIRRIMVELILARLLEGEVGPAVEQQNIILLQGSRVRQDRKADLQLGGFFPL